MVSKDPATNKYLTEHGDGHLTSDHHVIGDIFLYVAYRELSPIAAGTTNVQPWCNKGTTRHNKHNQEMMGWKQAQNHGMMTWTRHFDPHNIVNTGLPTTGASSAIHQYHLDECQMRRLALGVCRSRCIHFPLRFPSFLLYFV